MTNNQTIYQALAEIALNNGQLDFNSPLQSEAISIIFKQIKQDISLAEGFAELIVDEELGDVLSHIELEKAILPYIRRASQRKIEKKRRKR